MYHYVSMALLCKLKYIADEYKVVVLAGAMLGFSLARLEYLDIEGRFRRSSAPGEWYWYRGGLGRIGITMHLAGVLPAGILMVWQFIPAIRRRFILFHRINGYLVIMLLLLGNAGAFMITRHAFGGDLSTQAASGCLGLYTTLEWHWRITISKNCVSINTGRGC